MSAVEEIGGKALEELLGSESRPVLVDFWSPWCAPCRTLRPHVERVAKMGADGLRVVAVDVDKNPEVAARHAVRALPTVAVFEGGEETRRFTGAGILGSLHRLLEAG